MEKRGRYPAEVRERAVRLVFEQQDTHRSQWAAIGARSRAESPAGALSRYPMRPVGVGGELPYNTEMGSDPEVPQFLLALTTYNLIRITNIEAAA